MAPAAPQPAAPATMPAPTPAPAAPALAPAPALAAPVATTPTKTDARSSATAASPATAAPAPIPTQDVVADSRAAVSAPAAPAPARRKAPASRKVLVVGGAPLSSAQASATAATITAIGGTPGPAAPDAVPGPPVPNYSRLDETDLNEARALGLLRSDMEVNSDPSMSDFGIAYEKKGGTKAAGCGSDVFATQKNLQERCKQFAMQRGFQLIVAGSSTRTDGGGNVKYKCKKLHGQQFFDPHTPAADLQCPFYINGYGKGAAWKITRACFLHNHYKFIGWRPAAQGTPAPQNGDTDAPMPDADDNNTSTTTLSAKEKNRATTQRNTTLSTRALCQMVTEEVDKFPAPSMVMSKLDGKMIKRILLSRGHTINHMMASRIKRHLQDARIKAIRSSFQRLESYLKVVAEKNEGSVYRVETAEQGVFKRALFIPSATMHTLKHCRRVIALDHITPVWQELDPTLGKVEDDENDDTLCGVYLKAMSKDFNDQVITFALALVSEENQENWEWFLSAIEATNTVNLSDYTVVAGRGRGLQQALQTVLPNSSHHFCMRRIVEDELMVNKKIPLTPEKKKRIYELARSESESEFNTLRAELLRTNEAAIQFLDGLNKANWVKYAFLEAHRKPTFNEITCDLSMSLGNEELFSMSPTHIAWFGEDSVRSSQPLRTFNQYFMKLAENFHHRRQSVEHRSPHELVPTRFAQLEQNLQGSQRCESIPCANGAYMVRSLGQMRPQMYDTWRHVNLLDWECTCQEWQDRLFPCVHGIHAAELDRRRIDSLYDIKQNSVEHYIASYSTSFTPWPMDAATLEVNADLKTPLDIIYGNDPNNRRKPGPRPKNKKANRPVEA